MANFFGKVQELRERVEKKAGETTFKRVGFNALLASKRLWKRNSSYTRLVDKLGVRCYVKAIVPELAIPNVLMCDTISLSALPENYILKPSNNSGQYVIVLGGRAVQGINRVPVDVRSAVNISAAWLEQCHGQTWGELWYNDIKPRVFAEEYLQVDIELKFHCFQGQVALIKYARNTNFGGIHAYVSTPYTVGWNRLAIATDTKASETLAKRPARLSEMICVAEKATAGIDYVRFDLLVTTDGNFYFNEYTFAPSAFMFEYKPREFDALMTRMLETGIVDYDAIDSFIDFDAARTK